MTPIVSAWSLQNDGEKANLRRDSSLSSRSSSFVTGTYSGAGARFSKVPIINGPGKLLPFILKMEVSIVFHLTL